MFDTPVSSMRCGWLQDPSGIRKVTKRCHESSAPPGRGESNTRKVSSGEMQGCALGRLPLTSSPRGSMGPYRPSSNRWKAIRSPSGLFRSVK